MASIQTIKKELKMFILFFSLYFCALGISDLYTRTIAYPFSYAFTQSLRAAFQNPLTLLSLFLLPITLNFSEYTEVDNVDKTIFFLLAAYALGSYTANLQYNHLIMTKSVMQQTLITGVIGAIILCVFLFVFDFRADYKYILGIVLSSYVAYIANLNLSFHFPATGFFGSPYSLHMISLFVFTANFLIARFISRFSS